MSVQAQLSEEQRLRTIQASAVEKLAAEFSEARISLKSFTNISVMEFGGMLTELWQKFGSHFQYTLKH